MTHEQEGKLMDSKPNFHMNIEMLTQIKSDLGLPSSI